MANRTCSHRKDPGAVRVCAINRCYFVAPNIQTISLGTATLGSVMFRLAVGYKLNMELRVDACMSLNTIAHPNVYFRAILTSLTKSINNDPNAHLYWECVFRKGNTEFLNKPLKTCSHILVYSSLVCSRESADWYAGRVLFYTQTEAHMRAHAQKAKARKEALLMKLAELDPKFEVSGCGCIIHNCEAFNLYFCSSQVKVLA